MTCETHGHRSFGKMEFGGVSRSETTILISFQSVLGVRVKIAFASWQGNRKRRET